MDNVLGDVKDAFNMLNVLSQQISETPSILLLSDALIAFHRLEA